MPGGGRRGRLEAQARREQLLEAGIMLFGERAVDEVDISDIARAAALSRGLLCHCFPDEASFFLATVGMARLDGAEVPREERRERCVEVLLAALGSGVPHEGTP